MNAGQRVLAAVLVALLAAIGVVLIVPREGRRSSPDLLGPLMPAGLRAADFALRDPAGRRVSLSTYRGQVVVLTFIHSLCKDTCPFMVEQIKGALNDLPRGDAVPVLGVSVAPAEDTPAHRLAFLRRHAMLGRMAFLDGPAATMRRVWHAYAIQPVAGPVDHSTYVLLIDRRGFERVGVPADQLTPEHLAHDIRVLQREAA